MSSSAYRPDIQALRGIAVLLVVLYHVGVRGFDGGFIGVDVFFVISGFVIARSFVREYEASGSIGLASFYVRRIRRLAPALVAMLVVVVPMSMFLLEIGEVQRNASATALAALFAVANLHLLRSGGDYFGVGEDTNPFLHTWSLGVEEQFYVAAPLIIVVTLMLARRTRWSGFTLVTVVLSGLSLASFAASTAWTRALQYELAFYSPFSRFWEIGVGVILALRTPAHAHRWATGWVVVGFATLTIGVVGLDAHSLFPGVAALLPVLAAVALIEFGPHSHVAGLLNRRTLIWLGDRSYGWYLWHWPLIVFARHGFGLGTWAAAGAAVLALAPAAWSYRHIEFRVSTPPDRQPGRRFTVALLGAMAIVVGQSVALAEGADRRWGVAVDARLSDGIAYTSGCHAAREFDQAQCTFEPRAGAGTIVLIGDSHAASLLDGVAAAGARLDRQTIAITANSCPFVLAEPASSCEETRGRAWRLIAEIRPDLIVVAHNSRSYVAGSRQTSLRGPDGAAARNEEEADALWSAAVRRTATEAARLGAELVVIEPVPVYSSSSRGPTLLDREPAQTSMLVSDLDVDRRRAIDAEHEGLDGAGRSIDPIPVLCPDGRCSQRDAEGNWLYFDRGHLNRAGSLLLAGLLETEFAGQLDHRTNGAVP